MHQPIIFFVNHYLAFYLIINSAQSVINCKTYLSVTVTGVVVRKTSVTSTGVSVRDSSTSDVLLLTVGGAVVRPKLTFCSPVWDETPSVPSWFWVLELWAPVEDSVEVPTLEPGPRSVPEVFAGPSADEVTGGVEETDTSDWSVPGSVTLRGGVESEVSSDVKVWSCWVALGGPFKLWVPLDSAGLPVSENIALKERVMCWSVVSPPSVLVDGALWV